MTTADTTDAPPARTPAVVPTHGYTKDGTPVYGQTHHFWKRNTAVQRFNASLGLKITVLVGTMWAAYLFALIAFSVLPSVVKQHNGTVLVLWLSSEFLQLVLLPIIIVGQNIQARASDARAAKTFEDVEDARRKVEEAIDLLDINTEGGLHDAVAVILEAIKEKGMPAAPSPAPA